MKGRPAPSVTQWGARKEYLDDPFVSDTFLSSSKPPNGFIYLSYAIHCHHFAQEITIHRDTCVLNII